jgi:hypothetical protein
MRSIQNRQQPVEKKDNCPNATDLARNELGMEAGNLARSVIDYREIRDPQANIWLINAYSPAVSYVENSASLTKKKV